MRNFLLVGEYAGYGYGDGSGDGNGSCFGLGTEYDQEWYIVKSGQGYSYVNNAGYGCGIGYIDGYGNGGGESLPFPQYLDKRR